MPSRVSLRKTLRTIPTFQSLPPRELDVVISCLTRKMYRSGDGLWRAGVRLDFIGIIQKGEIVVEYRTNGTNKRSTRLKAGACFYPPGFKGENESVSVSVYAANEVTLYILRLEQLANLRSRCPALNTALSSEFSIQHHLLRWGKVWAVIVAVMVVLFTWQDATNALAGALCLTVDQMSLLAGHQETTQLLDCAARLDNRATYAHNKKGYVWSQLGEMQLAASAFSEALNIDNDDGPALNNLAVIYFDTDFDDSALTLQERAADAAANVAVVEYNLGVMLVDQGDCQGAISALKEATHIDPDWALPYLHLNFAYLQAGDYAEAEQAARVATRLDPSQQSAHLGLAIALYEQHKNQKALTSVSRAVEIDPENIVAGFYQALILRDLGDYHKALLNLQHLLELSPEPEQRERIMMEIENMLHIQQDSVDPKSPAEAAPCSRFVGVGAHSASKSGFAETRHSSRSEGRRRV